MLNDWLMLLILLIFVYDAWVISVAIEEQIEQENKEEKANSSLKTDNSIDLLKKCVNEARKTSVKNMWMIVLTLLFSSIYDLVYTLVIFYSSQDCHPRTVRQGVWDFFEFTDRFVLLYIWVYPVLYVFWPSTRVKIQEQNYRNSLMTQSLVESITSGSSLQS